MLQTRQNPILKSLKQKEEQKELFSIEPNHGYTVKLTPKQQEIKFARRESAKEAVGIISKGLERYIISKGQFSLIEFIDAIVQQTGGVHITISTWTASGSDISEVSDFVRDGKLLSCRFLVDFSFQRRQPGFCGQMRELFGDESIRVTRNHAKLAVITNGQWNITVFTSANLNTNPRMEYFLIRENAELAEFNLAWIDYLFKTKSKTDALKTEAKWHKKKFKSE